MAAVIATIETMLADNVPAQAASASAYLFAQLRKQLDALPGIVQIRGQGLLVGIECDGPVADVISELHRRGLLVVQAGPNVVRLLPNLLVTREEIDEAVTLLAAVLAERGATKQL